MLDKDLFSAYADHDDQEAFKALVDRHLPFIYGLARRRTRDQHLAEEVCQTTLCAFARAAKQQQDLLRIPAWLYRVTERQASLAMRSEHRRIAREQEAALREAIDRESSGMSEDLAEGLREALDKLSGQERSVLFLRYYDGHSAEEIGELYGIGSRAAQKRVERALGRLRTMVSRRGLALPSAMLGAQLLAANAMDVPSDFAARAAQEAMTQAALPAAPWWSSFGSAGWGLPVAGLTLCGLLAIPLVVSRDQFLSLVGMETRVPNNPANGPTPAGDPGPALGLSRTPANRLAIDDIEGIYQLGDSEREVALQRLIAYLNNQSDEAYLTDLFARWSALDAPRNAEAVAILLESATDEQQARQSLLGTLLRLPAKVWSLQDLESTLAWARAIPRASNAERPAFETCLELLAARHLDHAYQWMRQRSYHRDSAFAVFAKALDGANVANTLSWLWALPEDAEQALQGHETLTQATGRTKIGVWRSVLPVLYQRDSAAVCAWLVDLPESPQSTEAIATVVGQWAGEDPQAALTWSESLASAAERQSAQEAIAETWASNDPQQALRWAMTLTERERWPIAQDIFQTWSAQGHWGGVPDAPRAWLTDWSTKPEAASLFFIAAESVPLNKVLNWAEQLPANANRAAVMQQAFYRLGQSEPHQAIKALNGLKASALNAQKPPVGSAWAGS